ncbi:MAG: Maf family nucleotide pyrophosphatase [Gammaproteobacteria bacterium]|jgi:septum formation protein|nr:Maf family nucleotide pyrophosphatase [Gammaproteobacteria bacterium]
MREIVLASTSPYRRELLVRLGLPFRVVSPSIDESARPGETPAALVRRLAEEKARAVAGAYPGALIVGSDQVAVLDGEVLGKPGTPERAVQQLGRASGRRVEFLTGLCLLDAGSGAAQVDVVPYAVVFRPLGAEQVRRYLEREQPYDAAGSFKSEGLGIALFERMEGEDPTALVGLPLIRLTEMLATAGVDVITAV